MSDEEHWTPFRKQAQPAANPVEVLWSLVKGTEWRRAELRNESELQLYVNGEFVSGKRYLTRELAVLEADNLREALETAGFSEKGGA